MLYGIVVVHLTMFFSGVLGCSLHLSVCIVRVVFVCEVSCGSRTFRFDSIVGIHGMPVFIKDACKSQCCCWV